MDFKEVVNVISDLVVFMILSIIYIIEAFLRTLIPRRYQRKIIKGEVALVTGGAGGIGRLISIKLAQHGAHVIIWDINDRGIQEVVEEIKAFGGKCTGYTCDITDRKQIYRVAKTVKIEVGNVTIVVNNAGYVCGKTFMNIPDDEIEKTFKVNILAHYWINKAFLEEMMKENQGHIVTIASVAGLMGTYNCTDYSATKFAAIGYHESLFTELKMHGYDGIQTTLVCPYFINTGMFPGVEPRLMPQLEPEYVAEEVVQGILTDQINVTLPASIRYFLPLKSWLPAKVSWALMYNLLKGPQTMMMLNKNENNNIIKNLDYENTRQNTCYGQFTDFDHMSSAPAM
ncbi:short-chain dehydrogenase/reductase family 16C member 6 [Diachasmimorpha longicaudata]|uniref:short-chain dehydrogenase/reductase family 16C member 6 n=1 Tax=Diachasmimorpha longicaudata TaxID=58733 RepID=UPI0030B91C16